MAVKIKIDDIVDAIEMQWEEANAFLNKTTGEIFFLEDRYIRDAEDGESYEDLNDEEQEEMKRAYDVVDDFENIYAELPSEFDIHEYSMIENFCFSLKDSRAKETLLRAIRGKGAFRRFKDGIIDFGLRQSWFDYREECYKEIAREFCEDHDLEYVG